MLPLVEILRWLLTGPTRYTPSSFPICSNTTSRNFHAWFTLGSASLLVSPAVSITMLL
jgi:hypothetical protein